MIIGIGTDLISVNRIEQIISRLGERFIKRIFTENEIKKAENLPDLANNSAPKILFYAKRFAAKEAFSKAIGLGIGRGVNFLDIEVSNDKFGKPEIKILNKKMTFLKKHFQCKDLEIHLSLTDEKNIASAFVVIEKK